MSIERRSVLKAGVLGSAMLAGWATARAQGDSVFDIAIVGAGFSGLAAARALKKAGVKNLAVIEARDRVGGRAFSQIIEGFPVPAGATWVGPGQWAVIDLAQELGVALTPQYDTGDNLVIADRRVQRVPATRSPVTNETFVRTIDALAATVPLAQPWNASNAAEWDAMSYADYLATAGLSPDDRAAVGLTSLLSLGAWPEAISFLCVLFYIQSAGGLLRLDSIEGGAQENRIVGGSQILASKMADDLGGAILLSSPVQEVRKWNGGAGPVEIRTTRGTIKARHVIMALSPSQAAAIKFTPVLPAAKAALMAAWPTAASAVKVHVSYNKPFWRSHGLSGNIYKPDGELFGWATDASPPDGSIGIMTTLGKSGDGVGPEARKAATLKVLADCLGPEALKPTSYVQFDWTQETYTRGCVSPLGKGVLTRHGPAIRAATGRIGWAGTETSTHWMGYMDGAIRAGRRAAVESLAALARER